LSINANTVSAAAGCLLDLLEHIQRRAVDPDVEFTSRSDVIACEDNISLASFFHPFRLYRVGLRDSHQTHGAGPERAAMREACTVLTSSHHFWQQAAGSRMYHPVLTPLDEAIPERINTFRAHGAFLALHIFLLQQAPLPISIWLILALINGRDGMEIPANFLLHLDPDAYDLMYMWYDFHRDTPVPQAMDANHPLRKWILKHMPGMQPNLIRNGRSPAEHKAWIVSAFAVILLGHPSPWNHPEFLALQDGFNITIGRMRLAQTIRNLGALPFLVALYDRRVKTISDVGDHLRFDTVTRARADFTMPYFVKLFELRLHHYLEGHGHPPQLRDVEVTEDDFIADCDDPILRANLVLRSGSDSDLLPINDQWKISFKFQGRNVGDSNVGTPLGFHTCFLSIDVILDRHLKEILLERPSTDVRCASKFDAWVHSQFLNREHNTS
ncbi:hypothetical protein R3P38DRAFT_2575246, partial [Favolaschia claudopus]